MRLSALALVAAMTVVGACSNLSGVTAITDTTVINPRAGAVSKNSTVLVSQGRVAKVQPASARLPPGATVIDGRGKFLIPGLWDAHVHLGKLGVNALSLFVANGVTGVRDMGSDLNELKGWRAEISSGERIGPLLMISGPMLESKINFDRMLNERGVEPVERQRLEIATPSDGSVAVNFLADAGVDQIKMRTTPDWQTFVAVAAEAKRRGLPFAAHNLGTPAQMAEAGLASVEHFHSFPPLAALGVSEADRRALFKSMAAAGMYLSNTAANFRPLMTEYELGRAILDGSPSAGDPLRKYVCGYLVDDWREQLEETKAGNPFAAAAPVLPTFYAEAREMLEEKVPMMLGTDAAVMFVYPGFSLHDELEIMVNDLRLPAMEVLRMATDGVPRYWKKETQMGGIEPGQRADLILLEANPLDSISNTRRIDGVMLAGRWLDRAALDKLMLDVETDSKGRCHGGSSYSRR